MGLFSSVRKLASSAGDALRKVGAIGSVAAKPLSALAQGARPIASLIPGVGGILDKGLSYVTADNINRIADKADSIGSKIGAFGSKMG
jgi:hypothetical protein